jgi:NAD(P)-dependent dehydrogenase (short-subunit alcohol dehydrogenase family)
MSDVHDIALVTGAGRGIGRAIALRLARDGFALSCVDLDADSASATARIVLDAGGTAIGVGADVRDPDAVQRAVSDTIAQLGGLHCLVNNAGIGHVKRLEDETPESWNRMLDTNLTGTLLMSQAAARHMVPQGRGRIVNVSSAHASKATPGRGAYAAAKAGVVALTRVMAVELTRFGILTNAVSYGPIETENAAALDEEERRFFEASIPLGRFGALDEAAGAVAFLASARASFVNGHTLDVDGGFTVAGILSDRMLDIHIVGNEAPEEER